MPTIDSIGETSITLSWRPGASQVINKTTVVYQKTSDGSDWTRKLVTPSTPGNDVNTRLRRRVADLEKFVVDGLEPATRYLIYVEVLSFGKISRSPLVEFQTRECRFSAIFKASLYDVIKYGGAHGDAMQGGPIKLNNYLIVNKLY